MPSSVQILRVRQLTTCLQPWCRIHRLSVTSQLDIKRRPVPRRSWCPTGHHANRLAGGELLTDGNIEPVEAGQHRMVATAAIHDQQQPVAAERSGERRTTVAG